MGSMESILKMLPSRWDHSAGLAAGFAEHRRKQFTRLEAIINSMTPKERHNHEIISAHAASASPQAAAHRFRM